MPCCGAPDFDPEGHSGKALINVLESYPRDELFQIDEETLYQFAHAILQLDQRPRVRVLVRRDRFDRFVSVLVYVPRDRYNSEVRRRIGDYLAQAFKGHVSAYYPFYPEGALVRVHIIIGRDDGVDARHRPRRRWKPPSPTSCAPGPMRSTRRCNAVMSRRAPARCSPAIATPSRTAIARRFAARCASPTSV